jgi:hypothetical protein
VTAAIDKAAREDAWTKSSFVAKFCRIGWKAGKKGHRNERRALRRQNGGISLRKGSAANHDLKSTAGNDDETQS